MEQLLGAATDAAKIAKASRQIDRHLLDDSADFGKSRSEALRMGFVIPLGIQFEVGTTSKQ